MMRFEWNALRTGDPVLVHQTEEPPVAAIGGTVAMIEARQGSNGVGINVAVSGAQPNIVWPSRLSVHLDARETCWRCAS
jgi:hypothetical protein